MKHNNTVLVLGAGASHSMGYPVGKALREQIIALRYGGDNVRAISAGLYDKNGQLDAFITEFKNSQMASIDAFLTRRPEFSDIGRRAIATVLLTKENNATLSSPVTDDHWYQYFFNAVTTEPWETLDFSWLTVVTFNYDRSLESFLLQSLMAADGKTPAEVLPKLRGLNILHCYGTLGPVYPDLSGYQEYGAPVTSARVRDAASGIQVLPEGRADSETFRMAKAALVAARTIIFLGFGFDRMNLTRLDSENTCREVLTRGVGGVPPVRRIAATCLGLTAAEINLSRSLTAGNGCGKLLLPGLNGANMIDTFMDTNCTGVLRNTLFLSD